MNIIDTTAITIGWKGIPTYVLEEAGVTVDYDGLVHIPYRIPDGRLYAERVVAPNGRQWWRPGDGRPLIPYGLDRLASHRMRRYRCLAIVEGESDALALRAALGAEGLDVLGVPGARTWRTEWAEHAAGYDTYVFGDGDIAGRHLNAAVVRDIPSAGVVDLPLGLDVRDVLQQGGASALLSLPGGGLRDVHLREERDAA